MADVIGILNEQLTIIDVGPDPDRFATAAADHAKWRRVAGDLFAAAAKLWPDIEAGFASALNEPRGRTAAEGLRLRGPFYVLVGLSIENFAKALIIKNKELRGESITNGDVLAFAGRHDLGTFVQDAGITVGDAELSMLVRLSRFVQREGRYPVPKRKTDFGKDTITGAGDMQQIRKLIARLDSQYQLLTPPTGSTDSAG